MTVVVALAVAVPALAGCGGGASTTGESTSAAASDGSAQASANVRRFAGEWNSAVGGGDCGAFKRLVKSPEYVNCSKLPAQGRARAEAAYGPDGVLDTSRESCDLVDYEGRLKTDQCFAKMPATVGTSPGKGGSGFDGAEFETTMNRALDGLRTRNCNEFFKYALTGSGSKSEICGYVFGSGADPVIKAVVADRSTTPQPLGGNGYWQFYGMQLKHGPYVTLPVVCAPGHYFNTNSCLTPEPTIAR
jgi:hypothetical protein